MMMTFLRKAAVGSRLAFPRRLKISHRLLKAAGRPFGSMHLGTIVLCEITEPSRGRRITMHRTKSLSIKSVTVAGIAASLMLAFAGVTLSSAPAKAVVYCQYVEYPAGCVARAGVVLRPRPVARAAVRHNAGGNANGGVNRVGAGR